MYKPGFQASVTVHGTCAMNRRLLLQIHVVKASPC